MKCLVVLFAVCTLFVTGCASAPPQQSIDLNFGAIPQQQKIGLYVSSVPKITTAFPGAGCLLCLGVASVANSSLTKQVETFQADQLAKISENLVQKLKAKGYEVVLIADLSLVKKLPKIKPAVGSTIKKNYAAYKTQHGVDQLLVVNIMRVGVNRQYSGYVPVAAPHAIISADFYMIDTASNSYSLYAPINVIKNADGEWDAAPTFPGITNAFYQTEEEAIDLIAKQIN